MNSRTFVFDQGIRDQSSITMFVIRGMVNKNMGYLSIMYYTIVQYYTYVNVYCSGKSFE